MTGNGGLSPDILQAASLGPERALFDTNGRIVLAQTGVENGQQLRSFEAGLGRGLWAVPGGSDCRGLVQGDGGRLYMLNEMDATGIARMSVIDPDEAANSFRLSAANMAKHTPEFSRPRLPAWRQLPANFMWQIRPRMS